MQIPVKLLAGERLELPPAAELPIFRGQVPAGERRADLISTAPSCALRLLYWICLHSHFDGAHAAFEDYVALMNKCWAQNPADRPRFQDVITALRAVAA